VKRKCEKPESTPVSCLQVGRQEEPPTKGHSPDIRDEAGVETIWDRDWIDCLLDGE